MQLLRRLGWLREDQQVQRNYLFLKQRQQQQLDLLSPLIPQGNSALLDLPIERLIKAPQASLLATFATRCLKPSVKLLNALADINIEQVIRRGQQGKVPFSVKDHLKVEGMIQTCGFGDNLIPANISSEVVQLLEKEGCVAYAHSNVPQGLLGIESSNFVYGTSLNPHNPEFLSGGSSGGEAALVATRASAFGLGSDSGGSARIPAAYCGVYAFKPTGSKRLSIKGRVGPSGSEGVKVGDVDPSMGFLTRHIEDLVWLSSRTLGKSLQLGHSLIGGQWNQARFEVAKGRKLKVGYTYSNPEMKVAPAISQSIQETVNALRAAGHTVSEFKFDRLSAFRDFFFQFIHTSGFLNALANRMNGHLPANQAIPFYDVRLFGQGGLQKRLFETTDPTLRKLLNHYMSEQTAAEFFRIHKEMSEVRTAFLQQWATEDLDVLLTPVTPFTAPLPGTTELLVYQLTFCCFQNVLELPAGVIPTRLVGAGQTNYEADTPFEKAGAEAIARSEGLPVAIQISGQHLKDEECLGAMWQINQIIKGRFLAPPE